MSEHALLSASASERWLHCTPSARLEEKLPEQESNYAAQGDLAHTLAKVKLLYKLGKIKSPVYQAAREIIKADPLFDKDMDYYTDHYVDYCVSLYHNERRRKRSAMAFIEQRFDTSHYIPEGFGTSDFNVASDVTLYVTDLKYGQGVSVTAEHNTQTMIYALGVYEQVRLLYDITNIQITIFQPRLDNINHWRISVEDLLTWAETVLKPKAEQAYKGAGEFKPGPHCKFCRAKPTCRALAEYNQELARHDFQLPELLTHEEVAEIIQRSDMFKNWINSVEAYALDQAKRGETWPGLKLVEGRSNRIITNVSAARAWLEKQGYDRTEFLKTELLPLGQLEKLLAKGELQSFIQRFVVKPKGAPALVPVTHKRPAINSTASAVEDFKDFLT